MGRRQVSKVDASGTRSWPTDGYALNSCLHKEILCRSRRTVEVQREVEITDVLASLRRIRCNSRGVSLAHLPGAGFEDSGARTEPMGDSKKNETDQVIAAFDRERDEAHEHRRRHDERVRASREQDRPAYVERQRNN